MAASEIPRLGPPPEDLETRRLRAETAHKLFGTAAPDVMKIGRFSLISQIGTGGQGSVFVAQDPHLDRRVALKRLTAIDPEHKRRMQLEGKALARVDHPNVVSVYEVGEDETGRPYLVMELAEGQSLEGWLHESRRPWTEVVEALAAVGDGLAAIHAAGVIHRDIKPQNIVIGTTGVAKLVDLGIAVVGSRAVARDHDASTGAEDMAGTVGYIAPEHFDGEVDARSDQFGFCVTMYEALFGLRPPLWMTHAGPSGAWKALPAGPQDPAGTRTNSGIVTDREGQRSPSEHPDHRIDPVPRRLLQVLERGLQHDAESRYENMPALVRALRHTLPRPRRWPKYLLASVLVAGVGAAAAAALITPPDPCDDRYPATSIWSGAAKQELHAAFTQTGSADADRTFATIDAMLDATTASLDARWGQTCETPDDEARRVATEEIRSQLESLRTLVPRLGKIDVSELPQAPVRLAGRLERINAHGPRDVCEQSEVVLGGSPTLRRIEEVRHRAISEEIAGRYGPALDLAEEALALAQDETLSTVRARLHLERGRLALEALDFDGAETELEVARSQAETIGCDGLGARALALTAKALLIEGHGSLERADFASQLALEKLDRIDVQDPRRALALKSRGLLLQRRHDYPAAIEHYRRSLEILEALDPNDPLAIADTMLNLAVSQAHQGDTATAIGTLQQAIKIRGEALWPEHPSMYKLHASLSYRYLELDDLVASAKALSRALDLAKAGLGDDHPRVAKLHIAMARVLDFQRDFDAGLSHARTADAILKSKFDANDLHRVDSLEAIGQICMDAGWADQAVLAFEQALEIQAHADESTVLDRAIGRGKLAQAHTRTGDHAKAIPLYEEAYKPFDADPSFRGDSFLPELLFGWGETLVGLGRNGEARTRLRDAVDRWSEHGDNPGRLAHARWWLGLASCGTAPEEAEPLVREALQYFETQDTDGAKQMRDMISSWLEQPCSVE